MRALVTGATGFIGSHFVDHLLEQEVEVRVLTRPVSDRTGLEARGLDVHVCDPTDEAAIARAMSGVDMVFHVAGFMRGRRWEEYVRGNIEPSRALASAAASLESPPQRLVYVSSLAAGGPAPTAEPLTESDPPRPIDHYGRSKLEAERQIMAFSDRLPITIVRPPVVYGPRDRNFTAMFRVARRLGLVPTIGSPRKQISIIHASDLARGGLLAARSEQAAGQLYYLAAGTHTMAELVHAIGHAVGRRVRRVRIPGWLARVAGEFGQLKWAITGRPQLLARRKVRDMLQPRWICSPARAEHDFGFTAAIDLHEGMRETALSYVEAGLIPPLSPRDEGAAGEHSSG